MKHLYIKFILLFILLNASLDAGLVWTKEGGWSASGGLLEPIIGKDLNVKDAEDAMRKGAAEYDACHVLPAIKAYKTVYECYPQSKYASEALYKLGQIYMDRCQFEQAFCSFQKIIVEYPSYPKFNDVIAIQFEIASKLKRGDRPYYWGIIPGFRDYHASIEYYESIVTNAPYTNYAPMALMNISDLADSHGNPEDVIDALDRLVSNYRDSNLAPCAYVKLADTYACMVQGPDYDQGSTLRAINYYQDFLLLYPDNELVQEAECKLKNARDTHARSKLRMGDFYYKYRNNCLAAKIYYNETITVAPNSRAAEEAHSQLDCIAKCVLPPKTWVDHIFGRYQPLSTPAYLDEMLMSRRDNEEFADSMDEFHLDEIGEEIRDYSSGETDGLPGLSEDIPEEAYEHTDNSSNNWDSFS